MSIPENGPPAGNRSIYLTLTLLLQLFLGIGLILFVLSRDQENVFLTALVIFNTLWPVLVNRR